MQFAFVHKTRLLLSGRI